MTDDDPIRQPRPPRPYTGRTPVSVATIPQLTRAGYVPPAFWERIIIVDAERNRLGTISRYPSVRTDTDKTGAIELSIPGLGYCLAGSLRRAIEIAAARL